METLSQCTETTQCDIMPLHDLLNSLAGLCYAVRIQVAASQFITVPLHCKREPVDCSGKFPRILPLTLGAA